MTETTFASLAAIGLLAFVTAGCASPASKSRVRVTEEKAYIQLGHVRDTSQTVNLKKGHAMAMACDKCTTVRDESLNSSSSKFLYPPQLRAGIVGSRGWQQERWAVYDWPRRHYCPGCKSTVTTTGTWLNQKETVKHTCDAYADASVFCCATQKDATPTQEWRTSSRLGEGAQAKKGEAQL
jgi:hypothetical protein